MTAPSAGDGDDSLPSLPIEAGEALPPLHPALVHFPIALTITSIIADSLSKVLTVGELMVVGRWTMPFASLAAIVAAAAGYRDMRRDQLKPSTHALVHLHLRLGWSVIAGLILIASLRWRIEQPSPIYLAVAWIVTALVLLQAWLGGELVYAHGAGVAAAGQGQLSKSKAQQPSIRFYRLLMRSDPDEHGKHPHS